MPNIWINWGKIFKGLEAVLDSLGMENEGGGDFREYEDKKTIEKFNSYIVNSNLKVEINDYHRAPISSNVNLMNIINAVITELKMGRNVETNKALI